MTTLYRKWRPQTFAEVRGQERVVRTLQNALAAGRISHVYLFTGPRGVGKTTVARLFAKAVNCLHEDGASVENGFPPEPDNACSVCRQITEGRSLDVVEVDAASTGLVADVREWRDTLGYLPNEARYRVFILDEAHRLSGSAFDALLKTFEEPPEHLFFIMATTDPAKMPPTILSRCQRFDFRRISVADIRASLTDICAAEGINAEPAALEVLARAADGSSRDSQSLLDQAIAFSGTIVTLADVRSMLGLASADTIERLAAALLQGDARAGLDLINEATDAGVDPRGLNRELVEHLRSLLLLKISSDTAAALDVAPEALPALREQAATLSAAALVRQIKIFSEADYGFRSALQAQLPLELAFLQAIDAATAHLPSPAAAGEGKAEGSTRQVKQGEPALTSRTAETKAEWTAPAELPVEEPTAQPEPVAGEPNPQSLQTISANWPTVLQAVRAQSKNVEALLRSCAATALDGTTVTLQCDGEFHARELQKPENKRMVEQALSDVVGTPCYVKCVVRDKKADAAKPPADGQPETTKPDEDDPLVRAALRMLNARVLEKN